MNEASSRVESVSRVPSVNYPENNTNTMNLRECENTFQDNAPMTRVANRGFEARWFQQKAARARPNTRDFGESHPA
jgi:hypothetical protein